MIIEIDSCFGSTLLSGKKCRKVDLRNMYKQASALTTKDVELPTRFCYLYGFEIIPFKKEIEVDFVIDTDTGRIYSPSY